MTDNYRQVEFMMLPLGQKDDQGDLILPNFTKSQNDVMIY